MSVLDPQTHGCFTGDCPHGTQAECDASVMALIREYMRVTGKGEPRGCPTPGACSALGERSQMGTELHLLSQQQEVVLDSVALSGMELENAVRRELSMGMAWELQNMQMLLNHLRGMGFGTSLATDMRGGWVCEVWEACESPELCVVEQAQESPAVALARGALAGVRHWRGKTDG